MASRDTAHRCAAVLFLLILTSVSMMADSTATTTRTVTKLAEGIYEIGIQTHQIPSRKAIRR